MNMIRIENIDQDFEHETDIKATEIKFKTDFTATPTEGILANKTMRFIT